MTSIEQKTFRTSLKCYRYLIVLNVILLDKNVWCSPLRCKESVYEYKQLCTIENYNATSDPISKLTKLQPVYHSTHITNIRFSNSSIKWMTNGLFKKFINLKSLDISYCDVSDTAVNAFTPATKLIKLNMSHNYLVELSDVIFLCAYNLTDIDLSYNYIEHIDRNAFKNIRALNKLNLSNNRLQVLPTSLALKCTYLNLNFNNISTVTFNDVTNVKLVYLNHNTIQLFEGNGYLEGLTVTHNFLTSLKFLKNTNNLQFLDISFNPFDYDDTSVKNSLSKCSNLNVLIIKSANLYHTDFGLFSELYNLQVLDISFNNLSDINFSLSHGLEKLTHLSITDNNLNSLNFTEIDYLYQQLRVIDISENNWQCENLVKALTKLRQLNVEVRTAFRYLDKNDVNIRGIRCNNSTTEIDKSRMESIKIETDVTTDTLPNYISSREIMEAEPLTESKQFTDVTTDIWPNYISSQEIMEAEPLNESKQFINVATDILPNYISSRKNIAAEPLIVSKRKDENFDDNITEGLPNEIISSRTNIIEVVRSLKQQFEIVPTNNNTPQLSDEHLVMSDGGIYISFTVLAITLGIILIIIVVAVFVPRMWKTLTAKSQAKVYSSSNSARSSISHQYEAIIYKD